MNSTLNSAANTPSHHEPSVAESTASVPQAPAPTFEESIRRLGDIVLSIEKGDLTLEQSLAAFEKGIALARDAQARLDAAEARVDELLGVDDQGRALTRPVDAPARR